MKNSKKKKKKLKNKKRIKIARPSDSWLNKLNINPLKHQLNKAWKEAHSTQAKGNPKTLRDVRNSFKKMKFDFLTLKKSQQNLRELIENLPDNINPFSIHAAFLMMLKK